MREWEWQLLEDKTVLDRLEIAGITVRTGDRVRLQPRSGGDIMDLALQGQLATIEGIEQDYEGKCHVCVVLDDDPGRDLGLMRQPGHRFFFDPAEVVPMLGEQTDREAARANPRLLIAGIGNIFLGDDGFGVEVARRLAQCNLPKEVRVADFGIRGLDLAYALQDGYDTTILVDAFPHGKIPGTVSVVELNPADIDGSPEGANLVETHSMNPMQVLRLAKAMNAPMQRLLLIGCEPQSLGGEEGHMGLSEPIEAAVDEAVGTAERLVKQILKNSGPVVTTGHI